MKKIFLKTLLILTVGIAQADLSVEFKNEVVDIKNTDGDYLPVNSVVQLIWRSTDALLADGGYGVDADATTGSLDGAGGYVMARQTSSAGSGYWSAPSGTTPVYKTSDFVGMIDIASGGINTGYFFARVFENVGAVGEYFNDYLMGYGGDWIYDDGSSNEPAVPVMSTVFQANALPETPSSISILSTTYVVPEPATIGFMGIGLVCLRFLRMRKIARG